jgi:xylulokinase
VREKTVGASYGDAFLAAVAVGEARPDDIKPGNPKVSEFTPDSRNAEVYRQGYRLYREIYRRTQDLMKQVAG